MKKKSALNSQRTVKPQKERTYRELVSIGGANSDWNLSLISEDSEMWQNAWALTSRCRDLARCNPKFQAYRETVWSNVLGARGPMLRPTIKETEDRIVQDADEKHFIMSHEERRNRVGEFFATQRGEEFRLETFLHVTGSNGSARAKVKVGQADVFAIELIKRRWEKWQRMEFCDLRGARNYQTSRQVRLWSAIRDGDFFIRTISDPKVNEFGFTTQLINAEWCDRFLNTILPNGNEVRMGIEYGFTSWGIGKPVAYYFIKRQPNDWQFSIPGAFSFNNGTMHTRVPAEEIIHYARAVDAEGTRPAPWVASVIPSSRQIDQAMLAEVIAWRESACKTGFYYSDVNPDGGTMEVLPDPTTGMNTQEMAPGEMRGLKWGVKYQERNPTHPNANVSEFRKAALQDSVAGMPGANYSTIANDYEAINFSAGRLQRLDSNECYMLLQTFDRDYAENRIYERFLYMGLVTGAIPLPLAKFDKFNSKTFAYRSWRGVDEVKEATASALRVANHQSNDFMECEDIGHDFKEVIEGQAEANMLKEMYNIPVGKTVESGAPSIVETPEQSDATDAAETANKPAKKSKRELSARR